MRTEAEKLARKKRRKQKVKEVKQELKQEFKLNIPNIITLFRLILTFFIVYMIFSGFSRISIAIVFVIAALSDALDGFVARKFNQTTIIGARLDQVIDKIFTLAVVISLVISHLMGNFKEENFMIMLFLLMSREIIDFPALIIRVIKNKDLYEVKYIAKITTFLQFATITSIIAGFSFSIYLAILTCFLGIVCGLNYLRNSFQDS